jgi:hypothetical protein
MSTTAHQTRTRRGYAKIKEIKDCIAVCGPIFIFRPRRSEFSVEICIFQPEAFISSIECTEICIRIKMGVKRRSHVAAPRIKWWHLKGEKQRIFQHKILGEVSVRHKEAKMICRTRWHKILEK